VGAKGWEIWGVVYIGSFVRGAATEVFTLLIAGEE
jgi:hypothetical protein